MKTEYKILWIDNEHRYVRGDKRSIKSFLDEHGIELSINEVTVTPDHCPTEDLFFKDAVGDIELDMVFIDYHMPEQGDKIIQHIRKDLSHYYLPILFYTGDAHAEAVLQQSILGVNKDEHATSGISDGIYFCDRDNIFEKAKLILISLLKKEARPQQGRGLLMDRVSEIESKILRALNLYWVKVPTDKQQEVIDTVLKKAKEAKKTSEKNLTLLSEKSFEEILEYYNQDYRRWDSSTRATFLHKVFKQLDIDQDSSKILLEFFSSSFQPNSLLNLRNVYAHKSVSELTNDHDAERCKFIRVETRRQLSNIDSLLKRLNINSK